MKIIRPGSPPARLKPWWDGKVAECNGCGCRAELEDGDDQYRPREKDAPIPPVITTHAERHPGGKQWVEGPCPTQGCGGKITLTNVAGPATHGQDFSPTLAKP